MSYHDYIIVGAGPAGLQMGYFMEQAGRDYMILEGSEGAGTFFKHQPRHGMLLSLNKRYNWFPEPDFNLRHDWNSLLTHDHSLLFTHYSADLYPKSTDLVRYIQDFADKYVSKIQYNTQIVNIRRETDASRHFVLTDGAGKEYRCARLLMATGAVKPNIPEIEGIDLAEGYHEHDIDPERYANKRVVILGRGNSAFEVANHLAGHAALIFIMIGNRMIKHAWNTHFVGDLRSVNDTILDMFQLKGLHAVTGTTMTKLTRDEDGAYRVYYEEEFPHWQNPGTATGWFPADHVIHCAGFKYVAPELFAEDIRPAIDEAKKYPILKSNWESSVPDLYFIGTSMASRDRKTASGFIHGFRYNVRTVFHMLEERHHATPYPRFEFDLKNEDDLKKLGEHLINRISTTSALYQLYGTLCDVLVLEDGKAELLYELPVEYALKDSEFAHKKIVVFTLEFGFQNFPGAKDAMAFLRRNDPERPGCVPFLHAVFRYYDQGRFIKGRNTRSSAVIRYDRPADAFEGDLAHEKPTNVLLNFLNDLTQVTSTIYPEEHFYNDAERGGFSLWPAERRIENHGLPICSLTVGGPQIEAIDLSVFGQKTM